MYDDDMLKLIGYDLSPPFLGWVDMKSPLEYLRGDEGGKDLY